MGKLIGEKSDEIANVSTLKIGKAFRATGSTFISVGNP